MTKAPQHIYRPDVDGLRAIAVISVLLFHGFPELLPGGFVGVDIFFVISGFLISGIIFEGLDADRFSFADFYARRIRRIFPALILVFIACFLTGFVVLLPDEFQRLGKHIFGGSSFISNLILQLESGYFDTDAARKPLLHLWSLGVEEQYYLVWPLLLFLCRRRPGTTLSMLTALGLASFALSLVATFRFVHYAFYLPVTRFWELMVGSGLAFGVRYRPDLFQQMRPVLNNVLSAVGLGAIGCALALIDQSKPFPGWWALLVCTGAFLVISAGPTAMLNRRLLANPGMVWIGLISYPLYLWHWPLLSFARYFTSDPSVAYRCFALIAAVVLAWLTYSQVELRLRRRARTSRTKVVTATLAVTMGMAGLTGILAWTAAVRPASARDPRIVKISKATFDWVDAKSQIISGDSPRTVLFLGDSHMEHYWPRIADLVHRHEHPLRTIDFRFSPGCAPMPGIERKSVACLDWVSNAFQRAAEPDVDVVVIAGSWYGFAVRDDYFRPLDPTRSTIDMIAPAGQFVFDDFRDTLSKLRQKGKRVVVLLSSPRGLPFDPQLMVDRSHWVPRALPVQRVSRSELDALIAPIDRKIAAAAAEAGAEILSPADWICSKQWCPTVDADGNPLLKDGTHLRASTARSMASALDEYVIIPAAR